MLGRCRIILRCAEGVQSKAVAAELGVHEHTIGMWQRRFLKDRVDGLLDEARPGRPRTINDDHLAAAGMTVAWRRECPTAETLCCERVKS